MTAQLQQHGWYIVAGYTLGALPRITTLVYRLTTLRKVNPPRR